MKAVVCRAWGDPSIMAVEDIPAPDLPPKHVRIAVHAAGIGFQDILMIRGLYQFKPDFPFAPGSEIAGEIIEVGEGVDGLSIGARVIAILISGGYAEEVVVPHGAVTILDDAVSYTTGAALGIPYGTAHQALVERAHTQAGEVVLVRGAAGGVGRAAVEVAKVLGANVIAAASSREKLKIARSAGADHLVNVSDTDIRESVLETTGGRGADVIFDPVGDPGFKQSCLRCIAREGRILIVGFAGGSIPEIPAHYALNKFCSIVGVAFGRTYLDNNPREFAGIMTSVTRLCAEGRIKPLVHMIVPPERTVDAMQALAERKIAGRAVISFR